VRVDVIPRMSIAIDKTQMRRGKRVTVTGTVDPAQLVQCVVERRVGRRWKTVRVRNLDVVTGMYGLKVRLTRSGVYRITAISGTTKRHRRLRVH